MTFIPRDEVVWKTVQYLERPDETFEYELVLPEPLASWDVYGAWERERVHSMQENLLYGDTLFDIGTEQGWLDIVYAKMVGPENIVLVEPTKEFWPGIKEIWHKHFRVQPQCCYDGLLGDKTTDDRDDFYDWPECADGPLIDRNKYEYLHTNSTGAIPEMRFDDLQPATGAIPDALTIDVEGAELFVLQGAIQTLTVYRPLVWVSVHPDLGERDYGVKAHQVHDFMDSLGYIKQHLDTDHEEHWFYRPQRQK